MNKFIQKTRIGYFPQDWKTVPLGKICHIWDCLHATAPIEKEKTPWMYLANWNIDEEGFIDLQGVRYLSKENYLEWTRRERPKEGDLVFSHEAPIGPVAIIPKGLNIALGRRLLHFRIHAYVINEYLKYFLLIQPVQKYMLRNSDGTTVIRLGIEETKNIEITFPKEQEQQKIVSILLNIDKLIIKTQEIIILKKIIKKGLIQILFTKGIGNTEFNQVKLENPAEWKMISLKNYVEFIRGTEPGSASYINTGEGTRFIRVGDLNKRNNIYTTSNNLVLVDEDDILLSLDGSPGIVKRGFKGAISSGIRKLNIIKPELLNQEYLFYVLQTEQVQKTIFKFTTGITIKHATRAINHIKIPLPSLAEQEQVASYLLKIDNQIENEIKLKKTLKIIKKGLMQLLLRKEKSFS